MQIATILPSHHLHLVEDDPYHLCLSQVMNRDRSYLRFYRNQAQRGSYVIVDNGAAEGGCQPIEAVLANAYNVGAHELVLPDVVYDSKETLKLGEAAIKYLQAEKYNRKIMAVPQGETIEEWMDCAIEMLTWPINCLGISKFCTPKYPRLRCVDILTTLEGWTDKFEIHLLGCWDSPSEIAEIGAKYNIRGTDSAIAFIYSLAGIPLDPLINRPKIEMDFTAKANNEIILQVNIDRWRNYCNAVQ